MKTLEQKLKKAEKEAKEFLEKTLQTDEQFKLKLDWDTNNRPTNHPFIHSVLAQYAEHYHQSKVDAVSDEVIDNGLTDYPSKSFYYPKSVLIEGAKWLKNKLKQ